MSLVICAVCVLLPMHTVPDKILPETARMRAQRLGELLLDG